MAHDRIRDTFGVKESGDQLYVWHLGAQIRCYQPGGTRQRNLIGALLAKNNNITIHATKEDFTTVPAPGQTITFGTAVDTAATYRIDSVQTTELRPFYELELVDTNQAATAA
jgi:hypothetical protein